MQCTAKAWNQASRPRGARRLLAPVELDVAVPVRQFRVRNLLALEPVNCRVAMGKRGRSSSCLGDVQLAWSEFEVIETQLAVRITRLA